LKSELLELLRCPQSRQRLQLVDCVLRDGDIQKQQLEWSLLDTFDWLVTTIRQPQTSKTAQSWLQEAGPEDIEVLKAGHLVGRAMKPQATPATE